MIKNKIYINRVFQNNQKTLGVGLILTGNWILKDFKTIELPWKNNERNISCIPAGVYEAMAIERYSNSEYAIWLQDVPKRSEILIHTANHVNQLLGCIAPGVRFKDINDDGKIDIVNSDYVMKIFKGLFPLWQKTKVYIYNAFQDTGNIDLDDIDALDYVDRMSLKNVKPLQRIEKKI